MRRLLSWFVLCIISWLVRICTTLVVLLGAYVTYLIDELNLFLKILIFLFGGSALISILFLPVFYGSGLAFTASESICESKKGTRYIVLSIIMLLSLVIGTILGFFEGRIRVDHIITCVYYISLIIASSECRDRY